MDRVAVFVDAGYLFAQGSIELSGEKQGRGAIELEYDKVASTLRRFAERASDLPLLRIYWYDGSNQGPTTAQIAIARLDDVKVRLGFVNSSGKQKGVDSLIVTDMIALARNGAMAECVLLSGDEDLRVGVQQAQELGVRVHLLGVKPVDGSQSMFLFQEADTTHEWDRSDLSEFMIVRRTGNHNVKSHAHADGPVHDHQVATDQLQRIAMKVASEIPEAALNPLVESIKRRGTRPRDIDVQLLVLGRDALGRNLDDPEKSHVRDEFGKALVARSNQ